MSEYIKISINFFLVDLKFKLNTTLITT